MKTNIAIIVGIVLAGAASIAYFTLNAKVNSDTGKPEKSAQEIARLAQSATAEVAPRHAIRRLTEAKPTTHEGDVVQEKVLFIAALPEASTMDSAQLLKKFEEMGFEFETKTTESQKFGSRTVYTMKNEKFGFIELSLSYDKAPQGEKLLGLRATIPASQLEATKRILEAQKGRAQVSHQDPKFVRYERPDGYVLWIKVMDEETADSEQDIIGTVKIGLEPSQE
jgi:hypothetical protein